MKTACQVSSRKPPIRGPDKRTAAPCRGSRARASAGRSRCPTMQRQRRRGSARHRHRPSARSHAGSASHPALPGARRASVRARRRVPRDCRAGPARQTAPHRLRSMRFAACCATAAQPMRAERSAHVGRGGRRISPGANRPPHAGPRLPSPKRATRRPRPRHPQTRSAPASHRAPPRCASAARPNRRANGRWPRQLNEPGVASPAALHIESVAAVSRRTKLGACHGRRCRACGGSGCSFSASVLSVMSPPPQPSASVRSRLPLLINFRTAGCAGQSPCAYQMAIRLPP
jgi:hypothetical protein